MSEQATVEASSWGGRQLSTKAQSGVGMSGEESGSQCAGKGVNKGKGGGKCNPQDQRPDCPGF